MGAERWVEGEAVLGAGSVTKVGAEPPGALCALDGWNWEPKTLGREQK